MLILIKIKYLTKLHSMVYNIVWNANNGFQNILLNKEKYYECTP